MSHVKIKATELVDTNVSFVSLVKRGANRIPFRITKEDDTMLDFHKIGRALFNKSEDKPQVVAAVLQKGAVIEKVAALFQKAGLDPKKFIKAEKDGIVTVAKSDAGEAQDTTVIKIGDNLGVVVSGIRKSLMEAGFENTIYGETLKKGDFAPSLSMAHVAMSAAIGAALQKGDTVENTVFLMKAASDSYLKYSEFMLKNLPASVIKMDAAHMAETEDAEEKKKKMPPDEVEKSTNGTGDGTEEGKGTGTDPKATADDKKTIEKQGETGTSVNGFAADPNETKAAAAAGSADDEKLKQNAGTDGNTLPEGKGLPAGVEKTAAQKLPDDKSGAGDKAVTQADLAEMKKADQVAFTKAMTDLKNLFTEAVTGLQTEFKKSVTDLTSRVEGVAQLARKTDAALNGTVFGEAAGDTTKTVQKEETSRTPALLDTAYDRRATA